MEKLFNSFEECCADKGYDPKTVIPDLSSYPEELRPALESAARLLIVHHAHKQGKKFDWNNRDEDKHFPWWDMEKDKNNPSGFRLYDVFHVHVHVRRLPPLPVHGHGRGTYC